MLSISNIVLSLVIYVKSLYIKPIRTVSASHYKNESKSPPCDLIVFRHLPPKKCFVGWNFLRFKQVSRLKKTLMCVHHSASHPVSAKFNLTAMFSKNCMLARASFFFSIRLVFFFFFFFFRVVVFLPPSFCFARFCPSFSLFGRGKGKIGFVRRALQNRIQRYVTELGDFK